MRSVCVLDQAFRGELADLELAAAFPALIQQAVGSRLGCLNRSGTIGALEHMLARVRPVEGVGLLFIDLNGSKSINDSRGHAIGDAVLGVVACAEASMASLHLNIRPDNCTENR